MRKITLSVIALLVIGALSASADYPPPEKDEMTISELEGSIFDLNGKVVEVEVTSAREITQMSEGEYRVYCYYRNNANNKISSITVYFDEEGKEFFEELTTKAWSAGACSFYALIDDKKVIAIGERYKKTKAPIAGSCYSTSTGPPGSS